MLQVYHRNQECQQYLVVLGDHQQDEQELLLVRGDQRFRGRQLSQEVQQGQRYQQNQVFQLLQAHRVLQDFRSSQELQDYQVIQPLPWLRGHQGFHLYQVFPVVQGRQEILIYFFLVLHLFLGVRQDQLDPVAQVYRWDRVGPSNQEHHRHQDDQLNLVYHHYREYQEDQADQEVRVNQVLQTVGVDIHWKHHIRMYQVLPELHVSKGGKARIDPIRAGFVQYLTVMYRVA